MALSTCFDIGKHNGSFGILLRKSWSVSLGRGGIGFPCIVSIGLCLFIGATVDEFFFDCFREEVGHQGGRL